MANDDDPRVNRPEDLPGNPNAADPVDLARRRRRKRWEVRDLAEFWKMAFASPVGRKAMWQILQEAGTFEVRFGHVNGNAPDPLASWMLAGKRELGLSLYHSWMVANREGVLLMLDEHHPSFKRVPLEQATAETEEPEEE